MEDSNAKVEYQMHSQQPYELVTNDSYKFSCFRLLLRGVCSVDEINIFSGGMPHLQLEHMAWEQHFHQGCIWWNVKCSGF